MLEEIWGEELPVEEPAPFAASVAMTIKTLLIEWLQIPVEDWRCLTPDP